MKTDWDYTSLATSYLKRPGYAEAAIRKMLSLAGTAPGAAVCDIGAGTAALTLKLAERSFKIVAIEPNATMRKIGEEKTVLFSNVRWSDGTGENTNQASSDFDLVTFGSSFNVTDRPLALRESARILAPSGWLACLWNHRDLADPLQQSIEVVIQSRLPQYDYGARRQDQTHLMESSSLFSKVHRIEASQEHTQSLEDCVEAWRSHATLHRQAGTRFEEIIREIEKVLRSTGKKEIRIPYTTGVWMAQVLKEKK